MTPVQIKEFNDFFEHTRLMRIHQINWVESHYTSLRDKDKMKDYQKKVDGYIRQVQKLQKTKQAEIF